MQRPRDAREILVRTFPRHRLGGKDPPCGALAMSCFDKSVMVKYRAQFKGESGAEIETTIARWRHLLLQQQQSKQSSMQWRFQGSPPEEVSHAAMTSKR